MSDAALQEMATRLRIHSVESTTAGGSGHPTSCASMAELMSVLFFDVMRMDVQRPKAPENDRFILSKGHAAPIYYAAWAEAGLFPTSELLKLRKMDCDLEGHPTPRLSFCDVATGSLGQGLCYGAGMAYVAKYMDKSPSRTFVLCGDGEIAEGSVWEAMSFGSFYNLDNLVAIFDINRLGQSEPTMFQHHLEIYQARAEAFGWHTVVIDGHDVAQVRQAFAQVGKTNGKPLCIVAKTFKGADFPGIADHDNWHGKPLGDKTDEVVNHLKSKLTGNVNLHPKAPEGKAGYVPDFSPIVIATPNYKKGDKIATRQAYGTALVKLGQASERVVAMDGDTKNSTYSLKFREKFPDRFIECFIAEQNLVGVGVGAGCRGRVPFVSTFAAFFSRAYDFIRMSGISMSNCNFVGSHAGISIGEDGPSQMALEDLAMFRAIPHCVVFYPSDAVSCERALELAANYNRMTFTRTSRPNTPVIYDNNEPFDIGKAKVVRHSPNDVVTVVGAGITLHEALEAADHLAAEGIHIRVIDPFTIKPLDRDTIVGCAQETNGRILTVEDHYHEGGLGGAVCEAVADVPGITVARMAVSDIPRSGSPGELLSRYGIDAASIAGYVKKMIS